MKHRVAVTVSEPDHPAVSMRKEQKQKFVRVTAESQDEAITKAKAHYKKQGYKVHGAEYHSEIKEEIVLEGSDVVKSIKVGNFDHRLVKVGNGYQVKVYNGNSLYHADMATPSLEKAHASLDSNIAYTKKQLRVEELELEEAIKLNTKVKIHAPGKDYHDKVGHVGEIRHGAYKGAPKTYTIDYDGKSVQLDKKNVKLHNEESEVEEGYVSDAQRKAVWAARNDEKEVKKKKIKEQSFASYVEACSKMDGIKKAIKKLKEETIELEGIQEELEDLQEASFSYFVKKASEAKSKGNDRRFEYHMENARTARLGMTGKEMIRNRQHLDKYNELRNGK